MAKKDDLAAKVRRDLHLLECKIQAEKNFELRHQQQRARLEVERDRLRAFAETCDLLLHYGMVADDGTTIEDAVGGDTADEATSGEDAAVTDAAPRRRLSSGDSPKPDGLPTVGNMIRVALERAGKHGLEPKQVTAFIRREWWPDMPRVYAPSVMWRMARSGNLENRGGRYRLNGHSLEVEQKRPR